MRAFSTPGSMPSVGWEPGGSWRSAALLAFLLCVANILVSVSHGHGVGVLVIFIFVGLLNGVRGTFVAAGFAKQSQPSGAG